MAGLKALAYARVSTPEQADSDLSIPAQLKAIRVYAHNNGIEIIDEYVDEGISAFNDEGKRFAFNAMIQHAINDPDIRLILVHDSSRFCRNKYKSAAVKGELLKHGVTVIPVSSPYDPRTIDGVWRESIDETMAMTSSMVTAFHTTKGMTENASKRDPDTGYCYKNGGRPPYGYMLKRVYTGKDRRGKDKYKLLWEINPETAPILRKIVVDWRIGEGLSYTKIRDRLNSMNIPGPEGKPWGTSTLVEMLRDNRLMQYTGIYYWNKEDRKTPGKRYKDKKEWIEVSNAHPAILTMEEVESALALTKSRQPRTPAARSYDSPWIFTGLNLEGKPFFTCKKCGGNIIGVRDSTRHIGRYCCGTHHYKGNPGCTNKIRINRIVFEKELLAQIEKVFGTPESIDCLVSELNSKVFNELSTYTKAIAAMEKELENINREIEITFRAFSEGLDPDLCNERLAKLKTQRMEVSHKIDQMKKDQPKPLSIDLRKAHDLFNNFKNIYQSGTNEQKRILFKTYIRHMELDPDNKRVNVTFYPYYLQEKIKRGNNFPHYISGGVGGGT
ncbi:MAG: recombinase family protein [Peptococcaceae bacterium]|nr:recombinase family protein [Peptococcaceae bacterium]